MQLSTMHQQQLRPPALQVTAFTDHVSRPSPRGSQTAAGGAAEQSSSSGLLIADELQLGDGGVVIVFGCETKETGEIFNQEADGILGLGNSDVAIVNQVGTSTSAACAKCQHLLS